MRLIILFLLILMSCRDTLPLSKLNDVINRKFRASYSSEFLGGSGPGSKYEEISVSCTVDRPITLNWGRKEILELQDVYIEEINKNACFLNEFSVPIVNRENIHVSIIMSHTIKNEPWEITSIGTRRDGIVYTSETIIDGDWNFYKLGKEMYDEALKVTYCCGPFERVITYTKLGHRGVPLELHGPWGFFIQQAVIQQIQSGEFIYYAEINGEKCKLAVCGDQVVVEATGQSIGELFPPAPED